MATKLDSAKNDLHECICFREANIKTVEKNACLDKSQYYSKFAHAHKEETQASSKVSSLTSQTVNAELKLKRAESQVNRSTQWTGDVMKYSKSLEKCIKELEATVKQQDSHRLLLEFAFEEKEKEISHL